MKIETQKTISNPTYNDIANFAFENDEQIVYLCFETFETMETCSCYMWARNIPHGITKATHSKELKYAIFFSYTFDVQNLAIEKNVNNLKFPNVKELYVIKGLK